MAGVSTLAAGLPISEIELRERIQAVNSPLREAVKRLDAISGVQYYDRATGGEEATPWQHLIKWVLRKPRRGNEEQSIEGRDEEMP